MELSHIPFFGTLTIVVLGLLVVGYVYRRLRGYGDNIPIVNRKFKLEPELFSRIRWAINSPKILEEAHEKHGKQVFRLIRGDTDVLVMPPEFIPELNRISEKVLSPRHGHNQTLAGHLNGLDVVQKTHRHIRLINLRLTPSLPKVWSSLCIRIANSMQTAYPQTQASWTHIDPVETAASCVSRAISLFMFGVPMCDNPKIVQLGTRVSRGLFETTFIGRLLPPFLQRPLIWLFPPKWRLRKIWKEVEQLTYPEFEKRKLTADESASPDLLTWMLKDQEFGDQKDEFHELSRMLGSIMAGSIYSTATTIASVLTNLAAHPKDLDEIRDEIRRKHIEVDGHWDQVAFDSLDRLDSALKEASRVVPASTLSYARRLLEDHTLSSGLTLKKGQVIAVSAWPRTVDPEVFPDPHEFVALRSYKHDLETHRAEPYRMADTQEMRWGTGRWACPGRYIASAIAKIILVKVIDEYDLYDSAGSRSRRMFVHEFAFLNPSMKLAIRQREKSSGIQY